MSRRRQVESSRTADVAALAATPSVAAPSGSTHRPTLILPGSLTIGNMVHQNKAGTWINATAASLLLASGAACAIVVAGDSGKSKAILGGLYARTGTQGKLLYLTDTPGLLGITVPAAGYKSPVAQQVTPYVAMLLGGGGTGSVAAKECTSTGDGIGTPIVETCNEIAVDPNGINGPEFRASTTTTTTPLGGGPPTTVIDSSYLDSDGAGFRRTEDDDSYWGSTLGRGTLEFHAYDPANVDGCRAGNGWRYGLLGIQRFTTTCEGAVPTEAVEEYANHPVTVCVDGTEKTMQVMGTAPA